MIHEGDESVDRGEGISHLTPEELARLGSGRVAYVREVRAQDLVRDFPDIGALPPKSRLFVLHGADGAPIMLSDDRNRVIENARECSLEPVSLH